MCFEARKGDKRHKVIKIEEIQARSQSRKNRAIWFAKPEYPIFLEQIESELGLRFSLFRNDLVISDSKSYVLLPPI
jgi:hypothetical protein